MPTQTKIQEVERLKEKFEQAASLVLADYRGLTANEMVELREKFTTVGLEYRVVKDTLARIAADEAGIEGLSEMFEGPISVALGFEDPAAAFKISEECRKKYAPNYELKGGIFEGVLVTEGEVKRYATLPTREELLAKLVMLLQSPIKALAVMLQGKIRELAILLGEVAKKKEADPSFAAKPAEEAEGDSPEADAAEAEAKTDDAADEPVAEAEEPTAEAEEPEAETEETRADEETQPEASEEEGEPVEEEDTKTQEEEEA